MRLVLGLASIPFVLLRRVDDELVDEWIGHARNLDARRRIDGVVGAAKYRHLRPRRAGVHADHRARSRRRGRAVDGHAANRQFDCDRADIEAAETIDPERINVVRVFRGRERRQIAAEVQRIERRPEIDVERFGANAGEHADAGRRIRVDALRRQRFVIRHRRGTDVGRHRHERATGIELRALTAADLGHRVRLPARQSFRARAIEGSNALQQAAQRGDVRIAEQRNGRRQPAGTADRTILRFEPEFVDDVFGLAVGVVVDVDPIADGITEAEIVGTIARILSGPDVQDKGDLAIVGRAREIGRVVAHECVHIGVVGRWILRDERRFAVARRVDERRTRESKQQWKGSRP